MLKKCFSCVLVILLALSILPLSAFAESASLKSGTTGDCIWTLDGTVLTISGSGEMESSYYDKSEYGVAPWGRDLTEVRIEEGVTYISEYAFYRCAKLTGITIPGGVTSIGGFAFYGCTGLTSITIPNSVTSIGDYTFYECTGLTSLTIPSSVTSIGWRAFWVCTGLTSITVTAGNPVYHSAGNCLIETASKTLLKGCNTSVIPSDGSVTSIGDTAFYKCTGLTSVTIPNSVTSIGYAAFCDCTGLMSVTISDSVTSVSSNAFQHSRVNRLIIADGSKTVTEEMAACRNSNLKRVSIPNSVTSIGDKIFYKCTGLTDITIPNSVTSIGGWAFNGCTGLTSIIIPDSVTSIGNGAFYDCKRLASVVIPDKVTSISDFTFKNCSALKNITIPDSVTSIRPEAFSHCGLTSVTLPKSVKSIGKLAFDSISMTSVMIPNGVTGIDKNAFSEYEGYGKSRLTIYTDDISSAAYTHAKANGYRCVVLVGQAEDLQFSVTENTLEIIGSGKMPNYNLFTSTPWYAEKDNITRIIIDSRITDVGTYGFYGFDNLKAVVTENPDLVFHQYALNNTNTALTVYSYASGTLEQYCSDNGVRFAAPLDTPTLLGVTENTITVKAESGLKYSLDKQRWRTDGVFTGLSPVTEYTIYVRRKGGYTPIEGTPLKVKTTKRVIAAPAVPAIQAYDTTTVTLKSMTGYEYSKDGITWQQSNVFTGIVPNRIYGFHQRLAETNTDFASASSKPLYYAMPSKPEILSVGASTLTVKAVDGFEYSLDKVTWQKDPHFTALIYGMEYTVYQRIAKVDSADTYAVVSIGTTVLINGSDKKTPAAPSAPVVESKTNDTVTLKKIAGYEYRMDDGAWQKSPVFTGLAPNSTHRFYQRVAETDAAYASDSSTALTVQLDPSFTRGDLDGDEEISDWDGVLLARYLAGWDVDISNADALDIDGDGEITDWDGVLLDRYLAGWDIKIS